MSKTQTLHCQAGHDWSRPSQRGKPPLTCPQHRPIAVIKVVDHTDPRPTRNQVLQCKAGHAWARKAQKGKPPAWCPEHRPQAKVALVRDESNVVDPPLAPAPKPSTRAYESPDEVLEYLTQTNPLYPEQVLKLEYIEKQLGSGRREQVDVNNLLETRRLILARLKSAVA